MDSMTFLDEDESLVPDKSVSIIPAPLANTLSWGKGADQGPAALIQASKALESFDDELLSETFRIGIETLSHLELADITSDAACGKIYQAVSGELRRGRLPVLLGGEHTVTLGAVRACAEYYPDLKVLQIDAHLDLRDSYEGTSLSHACVMRRIHDMGIAFTHVGGRSFSREEWELVQANGWQPFLMREIKSRINWVEQVCETLTGPVYLTFDVDAFDPAIVPATGTPEPDGMSWEQVTGLLKAVAGSKRIVGCDFVELSPCPGGSHAVFTVAKLIYRTIGYIFAARLRA